MKKFNIKLEGEYPLYKELYTKIKELILNKVLAPNEKLPSKRVLSTYLNISLNTVIEAYNLLLDEELIISIPKVGYFVSKYNISVKKEDVLDSLTTNINTYEYDFSTKNIDSSVFPYYTWNKMGKDIIYNEKILVKSDNFGNVELRKVIANYLYENKGITINPKNIIIGSGIEYLLTIIMGLIDGNNIGIENPGYDKVYKIIKNNNKTPILCDLDSDGIIINDNADALYVTPSNQFPTGIKTSMKRKIELANWAKDNKFIIEDDFDSEFKYLANQAISLIALNRDNTILLSTYSRTISPALRISYMVLPDTLYDKYNLKYSFYSTTVSTLDQLILARFISSGAYSRHLNKTKALYKQKRDKIIELLEKYDYVKIDYENSYLSLIIEVPSFDKVRFKQLAKESSIDISLMEDYYKENRNDNRIIIGYSGISLDKIEDGIKKIIEIINTSF